jgi:hypothetical protein
LEHSSNLYFVKLELEMSPVTMSDCQLSSSFDRGLSVTVQQMVFNFRNVQIIDARKLDYISQFYSSAKYKTVI